MKTVNMRKSILTEPCFVGTPCHVTISIFIRQRKSVNKGVISLFKTNTTVSENARETRSLMNGRLTVCNVQAIPCIMEKQKNAINVLYFMEYYLSLDMNAYEYLYI